MYQPSIQSSLLSLQMGPLFQPIHNHHPLWLMNNFMLSMPFFICEQPNMTLPPLKVSLASQLIWIHVLLLQALTTTQIF